MNRSTSCRSAVTSIILTALVFACSSCTIYPGRVPHIVDATDVRSETVQTADGPLVGASASDGRAFLGIPYAAPPVGPLRWKAPQPVKAWTAARDATHTGSACKQAIGLKVARGGGGGIVIGSEDCLYLNVYTPPNSAAGPVPGWPVMVYIPGGAFILGAADNYDPSKLAAKQGVVVITMNYRLGPFGFFAHPQLGRENRSGSGNFGLLDQQAALRWVQKNVSHFGGDEDRVTLIGESAGAWSVCYQAISPAAKGLFQRAILQSGSCTDRTSLVHISDAERGGAAFGHSLGCDGQSAIKCLRGLSPRRIARAPSTRAGIAGPTSWGPVWGDDIIPQQPSDAFRAGDYLAVPAIIGSNRDEGRLFALTTRSERAYRDAVARGFGKDAVLVLSHYSLEKFGEPRLAYAMMMTDQRFACPVDDLRRLWANRAPVYGYEFADDNAPTRLPGLVAGGKLAAYHASELTYVFGTPWALASPTQFSPSQRVLSDDMMGVWGRFAYGDAPGPMWPKFTTRSPTVFELHPDGERYSTEFRRRHSCAFWRSLR